MRLRDEIDRQYMKMVESLKNELIGAPDVSTFYDIHYPPPHVGHPPPPFPIRPHVNVWPHQTSKEIAGT